MKCLVLMCLVALPAAWASEKPAGATGQAPSLKAPAEPSKGGVDWADQVLTATGSGAPDLRATTPAQARLGAEQAAKMDALRNLLAQAKGIALSEGKSLGDSLEDEVTRGHVQGVLKGFKITHKRYFSDNGVEIDVEVPLAGLLAALPPAAEPIAVSEGAEASFTGLLVDARGLKVTPAIAPRLLGPDGKVVYGRAALTDPRATVASYLTTLEAAKKSGRVGPHPLILKAKETRGADLVLAADDVAKLVGGNDAYLAAGKVAIVADGVKP